ncbi:LysR family transcriptional regulator [Pseudacidovorax intermedius]|uniref:LysR family transcriptional regulator n=1 Tax=Pseudacidovorax intermedius TaxID=433924 RepID=UPI0026EEAF9F|nr:LysR family transcriptional regulator [Pseudacidovorax intermedius]
MVPAEAALPTLRSLRAVMAIAAHGSTTAAAGALHLSQPTVARATAQMEAALGLHLFERSRQGMRPTVQGAPLLARMRETLAHLARADAGPWRTAVGGGRLAAQVSERQLDVVVLLATAGSQRRAASRLGVAQASVQQALAQVEHLAGEPLFDRLAGGLRPTSRGAWVAHHAALALREMQALAEDAAAARGRLRGRLAIGTLPYSTGAVVSAALQHVSARWPELQLSVVDGTYDTLRSSLQQAQIDIMVGALRPQVPADLRQVQLFHDPLAFLVRAGHPLLARRRLRLADLRRAQWVLPMAGSPAWEALARAFDAHDLPAPSGVHINSPALIATLLQQSDRLAVAPPSQWHGELQAGLLATLQVALPHPPRAIGFTVRTGFAPTPALAAFQEALAAAATRQG